MTAPAAPSGTGPSQTRNAAARWFARARSGAMTKADRAALQAWLEEDIAHGDAYLEISGLWDAVEQIRADPQVLAMRESALSRYPASFRPPRPTAAGVTFPLLHSGIARYRWGDEEAYGIIERSARIDPRLAAD